MTNCYVLVLVHNIQVPVVSGTGTRTHMILYLNTDAIVFLWKNGVKYN